MAAARGQLGRGSSEGSSDLWDGSFTRVSAPSSPASPHGFLTTRGSQGSLSVSMDAGLWEAENGGYQDVEGLQKCQCHFHPILLAKALMGPKGVEKWTLSSEKEWPVHILEEHAGWDIPAVKSGKYNRPLSVVVLTEAASVILTNPCLAKLRWENAENSSGPRSHWHRVSWLNGSEKQMFLETKSLLWALSAPNQALQ